jgi:hypothetical protein
MLNPQALKPGEEQHEAFISHIGRKSKRMVQYDYRDNDGTLFSCVRMTLEDCRNARDIWLEKK